jgi:arylsulfatase A-like enzyme
VSNNLSRRDFLKLVGLFSGNIALPPFLRIPPSSLLTQAGKKNVLIVVFDALSAYNVSLYGYGRETTPNINRLAERAIIYHNNFAACSWTVPSTASLMTGVLPWTHRAFNVNQPVIDYLVTKSVFHAFRDYYRIAYSHNPLVYTFLDQFQKDLDDYIPVQQLFITFDELTQTIFRNDDDISSVSWQRIIKKALNGGYSYSLFLSGFLNISRAEQLAKWKDSFPRGLPNIRADNFFVLEQAIDYLGVQVKQSPKPFFAYFHFMPPHEPYKTHRDFVDYFKNDGFQSVEKPRDIPFAGGGKITSKYLYKMRREYDEYILYADREFGRFFKNLEDSGVLEDTWLILTSDHGELFERGILGHNTSALYQPVIRIPLMIFEPGRTRRMDIRIPTSTVDLLPTLLHVTGGQPANWSEGTVLPPFADTPVDTNRNIYAIEARNNGQRDPLTNATVVLVKGHMKLTYYIGDEQLGTRQERVELYDIEADPEELNNLNTDKPKLGWELLNELKAKLAEVNAPYL